jgi:hypothetical protein
MSSRGKERVAPRSLGLGSTRGRVHNEGAAELAVLAEHPSSIGTEKLLLISTTDDDEVDELAPSNSHRRWRDQSETYSNLLATREQSLSHLDMAGHSDLRISLQRFTK